MNIRKMKKKKRIIFTLYKVTVININLHSIHDKETLYKVIIKIFKLLIMVQAFIMNITIVKDFNFFFTYI
jgi:hypothetical protein